MAPMSEKQVEELSKDVGILKEDMLELKSDVKEILLVLMDNRLSGEAGYLKRVQALEKAELDLKIEDEKIWKYINKYKNIGIGIAIGSSAITMGIMELLKKLL